MAIDLSQLSVNDLMRKFAAGGHKPGSGSAAALLGLTSCSLAQTVIALTRKHSKDQRRLANLEGIANSISSEIEPALWKAFQEDAEQFDQVIATRRARDKMRSPHKSWRLAREATEKTLVASNIPLRIAEVCLRLAEYGLSIFDQGFKAARGDTAVAIDSALSAATGAISIVYVNVNSIEGEVRGIEQLRLAAELKERAGELRRQLEDRTQRLRAVAADKNARCGIDLKTIRASRRTESKYSDLDIQEIARNVQNELWRKRKELWPGANIEHELGVLDASVAFHALRYTFDAQATLGQFDDGSEVAGLIDKRKKMAAVSKKYSPDVRRFTAAHELGHAVLHRENVQFRDRPLDGAIVRGRRSRLEYEADRFATHFLMPESYVRDVFRQIFRAERFFISDEASFSIGVKNATQMLVECPSIRDLSLRLAKTEIVAGRVIKSIATVFGVSAGAMAIRIEELRLIDMDDPRLIKPKMMASTGGSS